MKILIDINHPAHVHYFKNFIKIMELDGHSFKVVNRNETIINQLLDSYKIEHQNRSKRPVKKSRFKSFLYLLSMIRDVRKESVKFKPDIFVGFASPACAINAFLLRKPSIILDDTEHNHLNHSIYKRFCSVILTPFFFKKNLGKKQIRFEAYIEQLYLHSNYFKPKKILPEENYALIRFISYDASHDYKVKGKTTLEEKLSIVKTLSKRMKVYVSLEDQSSKDLFKENMLDISVSEMHDVIANSSLLISEGATMASEAGVLGTPYYYINPLFAGNILDQSNKYPHAKICTGNELLDKLDILEVQNKKVLISQIEKSTIDPTALLVHVVKEYPQSIREINSKRVNKVKFN